MNGKLYSSSGLEAAAVAAVDVARVDEIICTNTSAGILYLHIFDLASVPGDGTAPDVCIAVPATSTVSWDPEESPVFSTGCTVCLSSTAATKTVSGSVGVFTVRGS